MTFHLIMKYKRFKATNFLPSIQSWDIPPLIKIMCDVIERDMAPPLIILTMSISSSTFHAVGIVLFIIIILLSFYLMYAYYKSKNARAIIICGRILMFIVTIGLFSDILNDDHMFSDSTLP